MRNLEIFNKIAEALLIDYTSVYYVNAVTNEYHWFSANSDFCALNIEQSGSDFFVNMKRDAQSVVYEEDMHIFTEDIQKDKLIADMKSGSMQQLLYRLVIDGKPVYHTIRVIRGITDGGEDDYFILGVKNVDKEVRQRFETDRIENEREIFNRIAQNLADSYETIFYIDLDTSNYIEFSSNERYRAMNVPRYSEDFFNDTKINIRKYAHPDDQKFAAEFYDKQEMLARLGNRKSFSFKYRISVQGEYRYFRFTVSPAGDGKHLVFTVRDVQDEVTAESIRDAKKKMSVTFAQIAESLAVHYDAIYYIEEATGKYAAFTSNDIYGQLELKEEGVDFYKEAGRNIGLFVHPEDQIRISTIIDRNHIISSLEGKRQFSADYRLIVDGKAQYTRMVVMWSSDRKHFIIGVENINEEVQKEKAYLRAINSEKELARRDELTGIKNKIAYGELEKSVQSNIDNHMDYLPFAILVCDLNDLKLVNDTEGHSAGDEYIKAAAVMLCHIFCHSPVFRIGGDEFVVFLRGSDYPIREELLARLKLQVIENIGVKGAPILAAGMSDYIPETDLKVADVFERADNLMYENKRKLKQMTR